MQMLHWVFQSESCTDPSGLNRPWAEMRCLYAGGNSISIGLSLVVLGLKLTDSDLLAPTTHCSSTSAHLMAVSDQTFGWLAVLPALPRRMIDRLVVRSREGKCEKEMESFCFWLLALVSKCLCRRVEYLYFIRILCVSNLKNPARFFFHSLLTCPCLAQLYQALLWRDVLNAG